MQRDLADRERLMRKLKRLEQKLSEIFKAPVVITKVEEVKDGDNQ